MSKYGIEIEPARNKVTITMSLKVFEDIHTTVEEGRKFKEGLLAVYKAHRDAKTILEGEIA